MFIRFIFDTGGLVGLEGAVLTFLGVDIETTLAFPADKNWTAWAWGA